MQTSIYNLTQSLGVDSKTVSQMNLEMFKGAKTITLADLDTPTSRNIPNSVHLCDPILDIHMLLNLAVNSDNADAFFDLIAGATNRLGQYEQSKLCPGNFIPKK